MASYIALIDYTDQGIRHIKDSPKRSEAFAATAKGLGAEVEGLYWTTGAHDGVLVFRAADDQVAAALMLSLGQAGNVRTTLLRAFDRAEIHSVLGKLG